jgi:hypothetical protein
MLRLLSFGTCRESIALLQYLLKLAFCGELRGMAVCYWRHGAGTEVALTGIFQADPERALGGADLIKVAAGHQLDLFEAR